MHLSNQQADDFSQLISIMDASLKTLSLRTSSSTYRFLPLTMKEKSSAYSEMLYYFFYPGKVIPLILRSDTALVIKWVRASPTMRKRYGARGHPCLTPLYTIKLLLELPFRYTIAVVIPNKISTHMVNSLLMPFLLIN